MAAPPHPDAGAAAAGIGAAYRSVRPSTAGRVRRFLSFAGPGAIVAVGYVDPGNWATDLAGGSRFAYVLLFVVLLSSLMGMLLQALCVRLGIASGQDLAQASRDAWPRAAIPLWILAELGVAAADSAEVLGAAIALELLFGIPLPLGVLLTALDVVLLVGHERRGVRALEAIVACLIALVAACFAFELALARPGVGEILRGYLPSPTLFRDRELLYVAVGVLGATVMAPNLYLHSSLVQTRAFEHTEEGKRDAVRHATLDAALSLGCAMLINSAILVLAASVFHGAGRTEVAGIEDAHRLLSPLLGSFGAGLVFAIALFAAAESATLAGTISGQIVVTGFLRVRLPLWARRLSTRALAMIPALAAACAPRGGATTQLLVGSQVALSLGLPFAIIPLLRLTSDRRRMGALVSPLWMRWLGWATAIVILGLDAWLVGLLVFEALRPHRP